MTVAVAVVVGSSSHQSERAGIDSLVVDIVVAAVVVAAGGGHCCCHFCYCCIVAVFVITVGVLEFLLLLCSKCCSSNALNQVGIWYNCCSGSTGNADPSHSFAQRDSNYATCLSSQSYASFVSG